MTTPNPEPKKQPVTGWQRTVVIKLDKAIYQFTKHWLAFFNSLVFIYVFLPILAPTLMNMGLTGPAKTIYFLYGPMCHQMASRSFFLYGEQPAYPRALAGTQYTPIEEYIPVTAELADVNPDNWVEMTYAMREFVGNAQMGYKMALCERDMGIYFFILVWGLLYGLVRRRYTIKPLPVWIFILVGMVPIGLDGFSQLFGYWTTPIDGSAPTGLMGTINSLLGLRESTPLLRVSTGGLFGFLLAWLAYPHIAAGMEGTKQDLEEKLQRIGEL